MHSVDSALDTLVFLSEVQSAPDLYMFMKALAFCCWVTQALPLPVMMQVLLFGLLSVRLFSTLHISLVPFVSGTLRCQIPCYTSVVSRDTSSFRLLHASVWVMSLRWISSRSFNSSLISFVIQHHPDIPTSFSPICFWTAYNWITLMCAYVSPLSPFCSRTPEVSGLQHC